LAAIKNKQMNNQYDNLLDALTDLNRKGYNQAISMTPEGLYCPLTAQTFGPESVKIVEFHRFEGDSDVSDMAILYVIETSDNCKGVLIDAFGTYSNTTLGDFLKQTEFKN